MGPLFSIVIPSFDGGEYLIHAARSVLSQEFTDYELIVSLNGPSPEFEEWVRANTQSQLRILRWHEILSMAEHWQRALQEVRGKFVVVLGDDDGLLPNALSHVKDVIERFPGKDAYMFRRAYFFWPGYPRAKRQSRVLLYSSSRGFSISSKWLFWLAMLGFIEHFSMPQIYTSTFWRRSLLDQALLEDGQIRIRDMQPDVYSGVKAYLSKCILRVNLRPISWTGTSLKSNHMRNDKKRNSETVMDFLDQSLLDGRPISLPMTEEIYRNGGTPIWVAGALLSAQGISDSKRYWIINFAIAFFIGTRLRRMHNRRTWSTSFRLLSEGTTYPLGFFVPWAIALFMALPLLGATSLKRVYRALLFARGKMTNSSLVVSQEEGSVLPTISSANEYLGSRSRRKPWIDV